MSDKYKCSSNFLYKPLPLICACSLCLCLCLSLQVISLDEFREGCEVLNQSLHPDCQLTNIDHTLQMMDFDGSGCVNINEFFEVSQEWGLSLGSSADVMLRCYAIVRSLEWMDAFAFVYY